MSEWYELTLGDFLTLQRGFDLTQKESNPGMVPVISSGGSSYTTDVAKVNGPGVITGRKGVLGKVHWSEGPFWPHDTTLWVKDFKGSVPRFVYYVLKTLPLANLDAGASNPTLNRNHAHLLPIRVPDVATQASIAAVLSSFDQLIENNQRRVEVLEEMARAIYREWFVKFRYPGHEDVPLVASALGPIPQGWACVPLGRVADLDRTGLQPGKSPTEMFDHYSLPAFDRNRLPALEVGAAIKSSKFVVSSPAVLVSKLNPRIDRTWYVEPVAARRSVTSTEFLVLRPKEPNRFAWLYLLATSQPFRDRLISLSGGTSTSHQRTKPQDFLEIEAVVAPESVSARLTDVAAPLLSEARALVKNGDLLARLRDLLLPKLVTGAIDISTLDLDAWVSTGSTGEGAVA